MIIVHTYLDFRHIMNIVSLVNKSFDLTRDLYQ